jgi:hypothetical protein
MNEDQQCLIQQFFSPAKCLFVASALISLFVGTVMKSFVYGNLKQMKLKNRPINVLTLTELRIHHFCSDTFLGMNIVWVITNFSAGLLFVNIFR